MTIDQYYIRKYFYAINAIMIIFILRRLASPYINDQRENIQCIFSQNVNFRLNTLLHGARQLLNYSTIPGWRVRRRPESRIRTSGRIGGGRQGSARWSSRWSFPRIGQVRQLQKGMEMNY